MTSFLNPYHFLPVKPGEHFSSRTAVARALEALRKGKADDTVRSAAGAEVGEIDAEVGEINAEAAQLSRLRHDRYAEQTHSGRLVCRLTTVTPCVFGGEQIAAKDANESNRVLPYRLAGPGQEQNEHARPPLAIPATSLRGCIGSIIEVASGSSMRVLENTPLGFRTDVYSARTAVGMIVVDDATHKRLLLPLTFPKLEVDDSREATLQLNQHEDQQAWRLYFQSATCENPPDNKDLLPLSHGIYVDGAGLQSHCHELYGQLYKIKAPEIYYDLKSDGSIQVEDSQGCPDSGRLRKLLHCKQAHGQSFPLTISVAKGQQPVPISSHESIADLREAGYRIGIMRRLAPPGKDEPKMPHMSDHDNRGGSVQDNRG